MIVQSTGKIAGCCALTLAMLCAGESPAGAVASNADRFVGTWTADMTTVPPQQPPLKGQTYAIAATAGGYVTKLAMEQIDGGGGTSTMTIDGKILLDGKPYQGGMGETRSCRAADPDTIHCTVSMGADTMEETYALAADGKSLTDTMTMKGPDGKDHATSTVYARTGSTAPANMTKVAAGAGGRIVTGNGECEVTVPAGWTVDQSMRQASSPDYDVDVHVFTRDYASNMHSLAELKALNAAAYKPVKTFEDTPLRLWIQYAPRFENNDGWYVALLGKTGTCELDIGFKNSVIPDEGVAKAIAGSLKRVR
jgi:hypothetical protein